VHHIRSCRLTQQFTFNSKAVASCLKKDPPPASSSQPSSLLLSGRRIDPIAALSLLIMKSAYELVLLLLTTFGVTKGAAFLSPSVSSSSRYRRHLVWSTDNNNEDGDNAINWDGFNPLDPSSRSFGGASTSTTSSTRISLRSTQMQGLMNDLLNEVDDEQASHAILEASKDLLLDPLEDDDAVLEVDSVYKPGMTRAERYRTYRTTMQERIQTARNSTVRIVLQRLSEFVTSHE
jgi:hypothetical protein